MKDELAHGTSWAVLLCYSNFRISLYDGSKSSSDLHEKLRVASILKCWNKRCRYAIHAKRTLASSKELVPEQCSFPLILATMSLVC
jgi:hypothetical protein